MVPANGKPSPHFIMTGVWEPKKEELISGIESGFGNTIQVLHPEECGIKSVKAYIREFAYTSIANRFGLNLDKFTGDVNNCASTTVDKTVGYPNNEFSKASYFDVQEVRDQVTVDAETGTCLLVNKPSKFSIYEEGAYLKCAETNL